MDKRIRISDIHPEEPDDVIYYNIVIPNTTQDLIPANYNQIANIPILDKPSDYFLSIVRFSFLGSGIPIFNFKEDSYYITLRYNGEDFTFPIVYDPIIDPLNNNNTVFSYNHFMTMINNTFETAFNALKTVYPLAPPTEAPYMSYNPLNYLCTLYCQTLYDEDVAGPTIEIYFNNILYYFFDNFYVIRVGEQSPDYKDYKFVITNLRNNLIQSDANNPDIDAGNQYYKNEQEYPTLYNFSDTKTISFKSCLFPTAPEFTQTNTNQVLAGEKILTDFEPLQSFSDPSGFRGYIQYFPQGSYRLINLTSNSPLKNIDLQISYKDEFNNDYPLLIPRNSTVTVKLMFIKKSLYRSIYSL